jgi:3-oxoacyl-[acyl-carrier protein] reductase
MNLELKNRVAMIAAASKGIGKACALALAAEGCKVSICARNLAELDEALAEMTPLGEVMAVPADVSNPADLAHWHIRTLERFNHVDILVTNTGGPPVARFMNLTDEQWHSGVESTLMNVVRLSRLVAPGMQDRKWGRIIHLTSLVAKQPQDELTISSTLRAGLSGLTKTMANQFGPDNITVNAVLMGFCLTDRLVHLAEVRHKEQGITLDEYYEKAAADIPLRRFAQPQEIGEAVAFLASERASFITGVSLPIDGGMIRATM